MEIEITQRLLTFLREEIGCPDDSLVCEYVLPSRGTRRFVRAIDVTIVNPVSGVPVAIFEVKTGNSPNLVYKAIEQLISIKAELKYPVRSYIVFPGYAGDGLRIADVTNRLISDDRSINNIEFWEWNELLQKFPPYDVLMKGVEYREKSVKEQEREDKRDEFQKISGAIGLFLGIIFIIDYIGHKATVRWENLALLAAIVIIILLPYYDVIEVNGLSVFRKKDKKE